MTRTCPALPNGWVWSCRRARLENGGVRESCDVDRSRARDRRWRRSAAAARWAGSRGRWPRPRLGEQWRSRSPHGWLHPGASGPATAKLAMSPGRRRRPGAAPARRCGRAGRPRPGARSRRPTTATTHSASMRGSASGECRCPNRVHGTRPPASTGRPAHGRPAKPAPRCGAGRRWSGPRPAGGRRPGRPTRPTVAIRGAERNDGVEVADGHVPVGHRRDDVDGDEDQMHSNDRLRWMAWERKRGHRWQSSRPTPRCQHDGGRSGGAGPPGRRPG